MPTEALFSSAFGARMSGISSDGSSSGSLITGSAAARHRLAFPRSNVEIQINNHFHSKVYTTGDSITGNVSITTQRDVPFDYFQIVLLGTSHTRIDNLTSPHEASHVFLKLAMPIPESCYPVPRVLESGRSYTVPFHFVVPQQLTLSACNHKVQDDHVYDQHIRLPPTMGGSTSSSARWHCDDLAPEMARVEYSIKARVFRDAETCADGRPLKIVEAVHPLRVLPASLEDPPLHISSADRNYRLAVSKTLRKSGLMRIPLFSRSPSSGVSKSGKFGVVSASAGDNDHALAPLPTPIVLRSDGRSASPTTATVLLRFNPAAHDALPPRVTAVTAKLTADTYFSAGPMASLPNLDTRIETSFERRCAYSVSVPLFKRVVDAASFKWEPQLTPTRRDSGYCSSDTDSNNADDGCATTSDANGAKSARLSEAEARSGHATSGGDPALTYVAKLILPIELPLDEKMFIPTFHSCIASRTYTLNLAITVAPSLFSSSSSSSSSVSTDKKSKAVSTDSNAYATTLSLALPVQVVVSHPGNKHWMAGSGTAGDVIESPTAANFPGLPTFEAALEEADAEAHLQPRVLAVPDTRLQETSVLPGYQRTTR